MQLGQYPDDVWQKIKPSAPLRHDWDVSGAKPDPCS